MKNNLYHKPVRLTMRSARWLLGVCLMAAFLSGCVGTVFDPNYTLESGETYRGTLVLPSGNAWLEEDSTVLGNVIILSGNLMVEGEVRGSILMTSGNITLGPQALITGSIFLTSGEVQRAPGSEVRGQLSRNPASFGWWFLVRCCLVPLVILIVLVLLIAVLARATSRRRENLTTPPQPIQTLPPQSPEVGDQPTSLEPAARLKQLKELHENGLITSAEYETKKAEILSRL